MQMKCNLFIVPYCKGGHLCSIAMPDLCQHMKNLIQCGIKSCNNAVCLLFVSNQFDSAQIKWSRKGISTDTLKYSCTDSICGLAWCCGDLLILGVDIVKSYFLANCIRIGTCINSTGEAVCVTSQPFKLLSTIFNLSNARNQVLLLSLHFHSSFPKVH